MRIHLVANFLMILLLAFTQVDDLIFLNVTSPIDPISSEDDEFLPAHAQGVKEKAPVQRKRTLGDIPFRVISTPWLTAGSVFAESCRPPSHGYSTLYVFMSLRR